MEHRRYRGSLVRGASIAWAALCTAACFSSGEGEDEATDVEVGVAEEAVLNGIASNDRRVVFLHSPSVQCTGILLCETLILSVMHCVDPDITFTTEKIGRRAYSGSTSHHTTFPITKIPVKTPSGGIEEVDEGLLALLIAPGNEVPSPAEGGTYFELAKTQDAPPFRPFKTAFGIVGYGDNRPNAGSGVQRRGEQLYARFQNPDEKVIVTKKDRLNGKITSTCIVDSGGPLFNNNDKLVGVNFGGDGSPVCNKNIINQYALSTVKPTTAEWIRDAMREACIHTEPAIEGTGASVDWEKRRGIATTGDPGRHALVFRKTAPTSDMASGANVDIVGIQEFPSENLRLGYSYRSDYHCGPGAPRFNVYTDKGGPYFFGCSYGTPGGAAAPNWATRSFVASQGMPPIPAGEKVTAIKMVFDEGPDTPEGGTIHHAGTAILDNIRIGNIVIGKPMTTD